MPRSTLPRLLRGLCTLALVAIAVAALFVLTSSLAAAAGVSTRAISYGIDIGLDVQQPSWTLLGGSPGVREYSLSDLHGQLNVSSREPRLILAGLLMSVPALVMSTILLLCLRGLLDDVVKGQPFSARSIQRLRVMGAILILGHLLGPLLNSAISHLLIEDLSVLGAGISVGWAIQLDKLVVAALPLVLAEVFQHGSAIEADQSLTV